MPDLRNENSNNEMIASINTNAKEKYVLCPGMRFYFDAVLDRLLLNLLLRQRDSNKTGGWYLQE
jgi:hypothetical protein